MTYRILVTGSRALDDRRKVWDALDKAVEAADVPIGDVVVVEGGAVGADTYAREWARFHGLVPETHRADWAKYKRTKGGNPAGVIRNAWMVNLGADVCLAFPLEQSIGTIDCMEKAEIAGIDVLVY